MSVTFVTFGDGSAPWRQAARRLRRQAVATGWFSSSRAMHMADLAHEIPDIAKVQQRLLERGPRGFGYWIWKPAIIQHMLQTTDADFVVYADSGCVLNANARSSARFDAYLEQVGDQGLLTMSMELRERDYTKRDLLDRLALPEAARDDGQRVGGLILVRRGAVAESFCAEWVALCTEDDHHYLDDSPSKVGEDPGFVTHRHDQSILSCLAKANGIDAISDETYFKGAWTRDGADFPIWMARHRWGSPFPADGRPGVRLRLERRFRR